MLEGDLTPAPSDLVPGMVLTIVPLEVNAPAPTLALNGLTGRPILKGDGIALDAGDLRPGVPVRVIFDGTVFQLVSATFLGCSSGYVPVTNTYCIADQPGEAATFYDAIAACGAQGGRLCTISEWSHACSSLPWFFGTVTQAEWVDHGPITTPGRSSLVWGSMAAAWEKDPDVSSADRAPLPTSSLTAVATTDETSRDRRCPAPLRSGPRTGPDGRGRSFRWSGW
ncbi:MAG TPA: hypothetical protein PKJ19_13360 [Flavobacteriales bacterium]|nr:hypothetical protein [Flavobacteriales bacterium]